MPRLLLGFLGLASAAAHKSCCASEGDGAASKPFHLLFLSKAAEACPWLLLGLLTTAALTSVKLPVTALRACLTPPPNATFLDSVRMCGFAAALGLATPLCSCGAVPMAVGMCAAGAAPQAVVAFLTAAQSAGLDSAAITLGILGPRVAAFRLLGSILLAIAAAVPIGTASPTAAPSLPPDEARRTTPEAKANEDGEVRGKAAGAVFIWGACKALVGLFDEVWVMLAVGTLVTAAVEQRWAGATLPLLQPPARAPRPELWDDEEDGPWPGDAPTGAWEAALGGWRGDLLVRVSVIAAALPLQLCEHGVVNFAGALARAGATAGTAHAFLLSAPATNASTLGLVLRNVGGPAAAVRSVFGIVIAALSLSYLADSSGLLTADGADGIGTPIETFALPEAFAVFSVYACAILLCASLAKRFIRLLGKRGRNATGIKED